MKEQDLIDLGFHKESDYSYGGEYHYYVYDFGRDLCLISNANDESEDWFVEIFEEDNIRFTTKEDLEIFINVVNKNKKL
jgi:hypothetical protein